MKILITMFSIADYGGIVNYVEILTRAFRELGHTCDFVMLVDTAQPPRMRQDTCGSAGAYTSVIGTQVHVRSGWYGVPIMGYGDKTQRKNWRKHAAKYDAIIHAIPCPAWTASGSWKKVFQNVSVPQYQMSHDSWYPYHYPQMVELAPYITGILAAHGASYNTLSAYPIPRCFAGFPLLPVEEDARPWSQRPLHFMSAHMWKPLKHMDLLVQAIAPLHKRYRNITHWIGGDGIVGRYMRAPTKCPQRWQGMWTKAEQAGLTWVGEVRATRVRKEMRLARVMVDLSYNASYMKHGALVNTVTFEAWASGAVPLLIQDSTVNPDHKIFTQDKTHVGIPWKGLTPKLIAEAIADTVNMDPVKAERIVKAGRALLNTHWHYHKVAQCYLDFMAGKKSNIGVYGKVQTGKVTPAFTALYDKRMTQLTRHTAGI